MMDLIIDIVSYGVGAAFTALAFYVLYQVMQAENNKNTCPHPECGGNIKHYKQFIWGDVCACELCNRGLVITPLTAKRVNDTKLLHAIRQRLDESNRTKQIDIATLNYLHRLEGIVEARIQNSSVEVADAS